MVAALKELAEPDAVFTLDSGGYVSWLHRYFPFANTHALVGAVGGGMGMGVPAAVAAALRHRERQVICLVGDGGFLMTGNELATAVQYGARVRIIVANNRSYGAIRANQETHYPGRTVGTDLRNPDFAALARAFGAAGFAVRRTEEVLPALREALAAPGPALVEVHASLEHIRAGATLEGLRGRG